MNICNKENDKLVMSEEINSFTEGVPTLQDKYKCLQDVKQFHFMGSKNYSITKYHFIKAKTIEKKQRHYQTEKLSSIIENNGESYETFCDAQGLLKNQTKSKSNFHEERARKQSVKNVQAVTFLSELSKDFF